MSIYKEASKKKLRVATDKGLLSVEQLWDLHLQDLDALAVKLEKKYKDSGSKSFLQRATFESAETAMLKLSFDVTLDILETKAKAAKEAFKAKEIKEHNQKILNLIERKKEGAMEEMTIEELEGLLK